MLKSVMYEGQRVYEDFFGNRYQYDLGNPTDQLAYDIDVSAQMRDQMSLMATKDKNGGGIL